MLRLFFEKTIKYKFILFCLFFLTLPLLFTSCVPYPAIPNTTTAKGNILISSEPSGASIYLEGINTGFTTPKLLNNLEPRSYLLSLKLEGYLNSNDFVTVYPRQTTRLNAVLAPDPYSNYHESLLTMIEVKPISLSLSTGDSAFIDTITAFYSNNISAILSPNQCNIYSMKPDVASVKPNGEITAVSEGHTVIMILYSEANNTVSDSIAVYVSDTEAEQGNLVSINVLPESMAIGIGESKAISSVTAYYDNGVQKSINLSSCTFSAGNSSITISDSGIITGVSEGSSTVTVSYTEGSITKTDSLTVTVNSTAPTPSKSTYRALSIGIGDYINYGPDGDLLAPPYDVNKMNRMYGDCCFSPAYIAFHKTDKLTDRQATKTGILNKIQSTFSGAKENDVSYFYFSGHGVLLNRTSYLCPADFNGNISTAISINELESALSAIPGTKVVFIDSCHSGGFIGKGLASRGNRNNETDFISEEEYLSDFNENILSTFSFSEGFIAKDLLTSSKYQVLTSSHWYQSSYEVHPPDDDPYGVFTQALYLGCSLPNNTPADVNRNAQITLQEAYQFITQWTAFSGAHQNVQVYPVNSPFVIFEY